MSYETLTHRELASVIQAGKRLAIFESDAIPGWYVAYSPRNGRNAEAEGDWNDWVTLAKLILAEDEIRTTYLVKEVIDDEEKGQQVDSTS